MLKGQQIYTLGLHTELSDQLVRHSITLELYSDVEPNNPIDNIEQALNRYQHNQCQGIICLGGGSVMDCGKLIGARVARPDKTTLQLRGLFKIRRKLPPIYAIPTTAGTGSETTVAAVVFDPVAKQKFAVTFVQSVSMVETSMSEFSRFPCVLAQACVHVRNLLEVHLTIK